MPEISTKTVATLGPATDQPSILKQILLAGANVLRLNASHGNIDTHAARINAVRATAKELGIQAGVLLDLQGPKIRLGRFENGGCILEPDTEFTITTEQLLGTRECASTGYSRFAEDVKAGDCILLADGAIELRAIHTDGPAVRTKVVVGGPISDNKGINLPGVQVNIPSLTERDLSDLHFGLNAGVDMVALSFVRNAEDVTELRSRLGGRPVRIIAKIEKPEAWDNIESIIQPTARVIVARGALGVEISLEKVPRIQKSIIRRARAPRQIRDYRNPDAGFHDRAFHAHTCGSFRRRQCDLRRNRCRDALGRDVDGQISCGSGALYDAHRR